MSKMRRLVTAEAERQQELLEAQVWWEEHGSELPPEEFGRGAERPPWLGPLWLARRPPERPRAALRATRRRL